MATKPSAASRACLSDIWSAIASIGATSRRSMIEVFFIMIGIIMLYVLLYIRHKCNKNYIITNIFLNFLLCNAIIKGCKSIIVDELTRYELTRIQ